MEKKLIVLCNEKQYEVTRIKEEALKRNIRVCVTSTEAFTEDLLTGGSFLLIRSVTGALKEAKEIAKKAHARGLAVFDRKFLTDKFYNKMTAYEEMKKAGFFLPRVIKLNNQTIHTIKKEFVSDDVVVKRFIGKRGKHIFRTKKDKLKEFYEKLPKGKYLAQEFIEIEKELRVIIIRNKFFGAAEKKSGHWKKNLSREGSAKPARISRKIKDACEKAAKLFDVDIAGIDVGLSKNKIFIIEVNRSPGFRQFEKGTKKNVAKEIVKSVLKN